MACVSISSTVTSGSTTTFPVLSKANKESSSLLTSLKSLSNIDEVRFVNDADIKLKVFSLSVCSLSNSSLTDGSFTDCSFTVCSPATSTKQ